MQPADVTARIAALTARADQLEARAAKRREAIDAEPAPVVKVRDGGAPAADAALSRATLAEDAAALGLPLSPAVVAGTPSPESLSESGEGQLILGTPAEFAAGALGVPDGRDSFHTPDSLPELAGTARAFAASRAPDLSPPGAVLRTPSPRPGAPSRQPMAVAFASAELFARALERQAGAAWISVRDGPARGAPRLVARYSHT